MKVFSVVFRRGCGIRWMFSAFVVEKILDYRMVLYGLACKLYWGSYWLAAAFNAFVNVFRAFRLNGLESRVKVNHRGTRSLIPGISCLVLTIQGVGAFYWAGLGTRARLPKSSSRALGWYGVEVSVFSGLRVLVPGLGFRLQGLRD